MDIKLTNGKKTITRSKVQYEANINHFTKRGFTPLDKVKKEIKKTTLKEVTDKVVQFKPKKKKTRKKK
jgi:uncharacterized protein YlzI (FlbEa/FlbD family)|tara:strand:+ start:80 stop:283 length:204 start_codon:yes stop_codon:yes gene_type:complete